MDKIFCEQIDKDSLVEEYVQGRLPVYLRIRFEEHLQECEQHARAVSMEQIIKKGVTEFARHELRSSIIRHHHRPQEDLRVVILRYAAFLFVAVFVPLMLYYQFQVIPKSATGLPELEKPIMTEDSVAPSTAEKKAGSPPAVEMVKSPPQEIGSGKPITAESPGPSSATSPTIDFESRLSSKDNAPAGKMEVDQLPPAESPARSMEKTLSKQEQQPARYGTQSVTGSEQVDARSTPDLIVLILGKPASDELTRQIEEQISQHEQELKKCTPEKTTGLYFKIEFIISSQGVPTGIRIIETNSDNKQIDTCISEKIKNWKFDTWDQEIVVKKYFTLHS